MATLKQTQIFLPAKFNRVFKFIFNIVNVILLNSLTCHFFSFWVWVAMDKKQKLNSIIENNYRSTKQNICNIYIQHLFR